MSTTYYASSTTTDYAKLHIATDLRQASLTGDGVIMSKRIERTLASLLLALVAGGGSSKIH